MDYFAGLDISMDESHVCLLDREGVVVHETMTASMAQAIADELARAPSCRRIVFETGVVYRGRGGGLFSRRQTVGSAVE